MSETATSSLPSVGARQLPWLGATLLTLSAVTFSLLAIYGTLCGLHGRHFWVVGAVVAFGLVPAIRLFAPERKLQWLTHAALVVLAALFFASGASEGGSFVMWVAGSLTVFGPMLVWVLEPDHDEPPAATEMASAALNENEIEPALQTAA